MLMTGLGITSDCYFSPSSLKISATDQNQIINSLKQCEIHWEKGETVEFALSQLLIHWGFWVCRGFDSLHRSTSPPLILNGLPMR